VTIGPSGLHLNKAAVDLLDRPAAVELLYDRERRIVGVRATADREDLSAFKLSITRDGGGAKVAAHSFTNHYGVDTTHARRWPAYLDGGVLCVDLNGDGTPVTSNRSSTKAIR